MALNLFSQLPGAGVHNEHEIFDALLVAPGIKIERILSTGQARTVNCRHKKTTFRWFHDTAYCFDYSLLSHGSRSGT